jgi:hypothetical protein
VAAATTVARALDILFIVSSLAVEKFLLFFCTL